MWKSNFDVHFSSILFRKQMLVCFTFIIWYARRSHSSDYAYDFERLFRLHTQNGTHTRKWAALWSAKDRWYSTDRQIIFCQSKYSRIASSESAWISAALQFIEESHCRDHHSSQMIWFIEIQSTSFNIVPSIFPFCLIIRWDQKLGFKKKHIFSVECNFLYLFWGQKCSAVADCSFRKWAFQGIALNAIPLYVFLYVMTGEGNDTRERWSVELHLNSLIYNITEMRNSGKLFT